MIPASLPLFFIYAAVFPAIAEAKRRRQMEEEEMSEYPENKFQNEWEYKILRANRSVFKKPEVFHRVCAEERKAAWILVEKFDDMRLRFKRPMSARENDQRLKLDPYRTRYGMAPGALAAAIVGLVFVIIILAVLLIRFSGH